MFAGGGRIDAYHEVVGFAPAFVAVVSRWGRGQVCAISGLSVGASMRASCPAPAVWPEAKLADAALAGFGG